MSVLGRFRLFVINDVLTSVLIHPRIRVAFLRRLGVKVGHGAVVYAGVSIVGRDVMIGRESYVGRGTFLDGDGPVRIGDGVNLAQYVRLHTASHKIGPSARRAGPLTHEPVTIGDGSWVGAGSSVLPGVTVGPGCIIGAGSLVTADCEPNGLYVGRPARRVRDL